MRCSMIILRAARVPDADTFRVPQWYGNRIGQVLVSETFCSSTAGLAACRGGCDCDLTDI